MMSRSILFTILFSALYCVQGKAQSIRILTYNIHHAQNEAGKLDVEGLAAYIAAQKPDVVALQEVDSACGRSNRWDIVRELGRLTGMYFYFGKAMDYDGGGYGEGFLCRWPVTAIRTIALPIQPNKSREPRAAIEAVIKTPAGRSFKFIATHLDHLQDETDRVLQTKALYELYRNEQLPFIIAGDLNAQPASNPMKELYPIVQLPPNDKQQFTCPSSNPTMKIDYILLSKNHPWRCTQFKVLPEKNISDHLPVIAVLELK